VSRLLWWAASRRPDQRPGGFGQRAHLPNSSGVARLVTTGRDARFHGRQDARRYNHMATFLNCRAKNKSVQGAGRTAALQDAIARFGTG